MSRNYTDAPAPPQPENKMKSVPFRKVCNGGHAQSFSPATITSNRFMSGILANQKSPAIHLWFPEFPRIGKAGKNSGV
jgi:hypothetical protein